MVINCADVINTILIYNFFKHSTNYRFQIISIFNNYICNFLQIFIFIIE